jgi:hypothetical protein
VNPFSTAEFVVVWLEEKMSLKVRVFLVVILGLTIITLTNYGAKATGADVLYAEMFHTVADTLGAIVLLVALFVRGMLLKLLAKISGALLLLAGFVAWFKSYTTLVYIVSTRVYMIERMDILFWVS